MITHLASLAHYNRWANERVFAAARRLHEEDLRRPVGTFFHSLIGTLNHLLVTDRIWLSRLEGGEVPPHSLDTILFSDLHELAHARRAEDERLIRWFDGKDDMAAESHCAFQMMSGRRVSLPTSRVLLHLFHHQTHHRGQAHTCLTILSPEEPPVLDLLVFQLDTQPR